MQLLTLYNLAISTVSATYPSVRAVSISFWSVPAKVLRRLKNRDLLNNVSQEHNKNLILIN